MRMHTVIGDRPEIEYLAGRPVPKMSPQLNHGLVQYAATTILRRCAGERGYVAPEWRFRLAPVLRTRTSLLPDVAFLLHERRNALELRHRQEPTIAPDIVVEVRSPSLKLANLEWKVKAYLEAGSLLVLDVDPRRRRVRAVSRDGTRFYECGDDFEHNAVPWLRFKVAELFADLETS